MEQAEATLYLVFHERLIHLDGLQYRGEGGVSAVVRPIGVEDTQFGLRRVPLLLAEVRHHFGEVIGIHRQPPLFAESL